MTPILYGDSIVIDIETVASPDAERLIGPIKAPAHYKDVFKIKTYEQDKLAEKVATASLEADLCEVVAVGCMAGGECQVMTRANADEGFLIDWLWEMVGQKRIIGYNILNFDLPVLIRRSQLLGADHPIINLDRYRTPHMDLLEKLSFSGRLSLRSLSFYCRRFGIEAPEDATAGSDIPGLVAAGEWDLIRHHCEVDVTKTAKLAERLGYLSWPSSSPAATAAS